ncbi:MAG: hypothetical protein WBA16_10765 [Nonlabens sp.]
MSIRIDPEVSKWIVQITKAFAGGVEVDFGCLDVLVTQQVLYDL